MTSPAAVPENPPSTASGLGLLRVLDATDGVAGQFCGRLFADHGADVILLETLEGTRTRGEDDLSWHLNCGKRAVAGDPLTFGGDDLDALLRGLDVVIVDQNTAPFGWDLATHPRLVVCCMSDLGAIGPHASWQGSELVHQAYSGLAYSTGRVDAEPLYGFGHRAYYCAGLGAYGATLAALVERECSGTGQKVRVSVAETAAAMSQNLVTIYSYSQTVPRQGAYEGPLSCYWCADGWIVVFVSTGRWPAVCEAFGLTKSQDDPRFADGAAQAKNWPAASRLLAGAARTRRAQDLVEAAQSRRVPASVVLTPEAVRACPHLAARSYWAHARTPNGARTRLGPVARAGFLGTLPEAPAPELGAHTEAVLHAWREPHDEAAVVRRVGRQRPLAGIRVIELTTAWAGPMAGRILAYLGAEVIKVECRRAIDHWRGGARGDPRRFPDPQPGRHPHNRSGWFNTQNHDKKSVELDLRTPGGQAAVRELVSGSEVLICNLAPGALVVLNAQPGIGGTELARRLGLSQPGGTRLAEVLEQRGLVERRPGADGRAVSVRLTAAGRRSAATVLAARQKLTAEFPSDVDQADRMALDRVLAGVLERLTGSAAPPYYLCRFCDEAACTRDRRDCPVELAWQEREQPASDRREGSRWSR